ncbi:MAG: methyltransferase domain-containing protein [Myxococcota bacterium]|nr:methyltransferase domain-containing protein [Myxococcota bacterium]MDW8361155.1 methyltransferase domain-containing protein [Myxococcales bacterium]
MAPRTSRDAPVTERPPYHLLAPRPPAEGAVDLDALVPGQGPLELDLGFGRGASLFARAAVAPDARILGIEVKPRLVVHTDRRLRAAGLDRVRVLCADARELLARAGPARSVRAVAIHFPDPWWKRRQRKRALVCDALLDALARLLRPGGMLFIQTDVLERGQQYEAMIRAHPSFRLAPTPADNPLGAPSHRELRIVRDGLPVARILAYRTDDEVPP